jgi:hypothetical protein
LHTLVETAQYTLRCDYRRGIVHVYRSSTPFDTIGELDTCFARIDRALEAIHRGRFVLYIDTRDGPVRNDPAFEAAFERHRRRLIAGFSRAAVLVKTAAGRLQVQRHAHGDKLGVHVCVSEEEARTRLGIHGDLKL